MKTQSHILLVLALGLLIAIDSGCRRIRPPAPPTQPAPKSQPAAASKPATSKPAPKLLEYKIRQGDTLRKIAVRECGSSAAEYKIKKYNPDLDEKNLKVGQVIMIPEKKVKTPPAVKP